MNKIIMRVWLWLVYAFLYVPILVVIVYSFNNAKYSTAWSGFTLKWYEMCLANTALIDAALNSLSVGAVSATLATILATAGTPVFLRTAQTFGTWPDLTGATWTDETTSRAPAIAFRAAL